MPCIVMPEREGTVILVGVSIRVVVSVVRIRESNDLTMDNFLHNRLSVENIYNKKSIKLLLAQRRVVV